MLLNNIWTEIITHNNDKQRENFHNDTDNMNSCHTWQA